MFMKRNCCIAVPVNGAPSGLARAYLPGGSASIMLHIDHGDAACSWCAHSNTKYTVTILVLSITVTGRFTSEAFMQLMLCCMPCTIA
jgi:hypothetical protein